MPSKGQFTFFTKSFDFYVLRHCALRRTLHDHCQSLLLRRLIFQVFKLIHWFTWLVELECFLILAFIFLKSVWPVTVQLVSPPNKRHEKQYKVFSTSQPHNQGWFLYKSKLNFCTYFFPPLFATLRKELHDSHHVTQS